MDQPPTSQLMHDLMQHSSETRGCVVSVTTKNGDRYSGIFSKFELVSSEQCCIWLIYTQKLDSTSQKANERSDYPYCDNMKIPCDQLSHMEVLIEQEKERYDAISCQSRELIRYNFGYGSANDSDGNSSIDLEWFEETELDSDGNPIDDDDNDDCSGDCESQFSQFGDKDEWDGFNEDDYTTVLPRGVSEKDFAEAEIIAQTIRNSHNCDILQDETAGGRDRQQEQEKMSKDKNRHKNYFKNSNKHRNRNENEKTTNESEMTHGNILQNDDSNDNNNNSKNVNVRDLEELIKNVSKPCNSAVYDGALHEGIEQVQSSADYCAAVMQIKEIEDKYNRVWEQYHNSSNNNNNITNNNKLVQSQMHNKLKIAKDKEIYTFLESQTPEICDLIFASVFAGECCKELINEFDLQFLIPLKDEWMKQNNDILNCKGFSEIEKENAFCNEYALLVLRKHELKRDAILVGHLIYFGEYEYILNLRMDVLNDILKCYKKQMAGDPSLSQSSSSSSSSFGSSSSNVEDEPFDYFKDKTEELFFTNVLKWIDDRLNGIVNDCNDEMIVQRIQNTRTFQDCHFFAELNSCQQERQGQGQRPAQIQTQGQQQHRQQEQQINQITQTVHAEKQVKQERQLTDENLTWWQQMIQDVTGMCNFALYEYIQELQMSKEYVVVLNEIEAIKNKYKKEKLQYRMNKRDKLIHKLEKEREIEGVRSQNVYISNFISATSFGDKFRRQWFKQFDLKCLRPLSDKWMKMKDNEWNNVCHRVLKNHPFLFSKRKELGRDVYLMAYLIYLGSYTYRFNLRKQIVDSIYQHKKNDREQTQELFYNIILECVDCQLNKITRGSHVVISRISISENVSLSNGLSLNAQANDFSPKSGTSDTACKNVFFSAYEEHRIQQQEIENNKKLQNFLDMTHSNNDQVRYRFDVCVSLLQGYRKIDLSTARLSVWSEFCINRGIQQEIDYLLYERRNNHHIS